MGDQQGSSRGEGDSEMECSHKRACRSVASAKLSEWRYINQKHCHSHHLVRFHETMRDGLLEAKTGPLLILQDTDVDRECASLLLHLRKHCARIL